MKNCILLLLGLISLSACGKKDKAELDADYNRTHEIGDGEISKNVEELLASEWVESCDHVAAPMMREMAKVLDTKVSEINAFMKTVPSTDRSKTVPFGDSQLTVYAPSYSKDEWLSNHESWTGAYALYQRAKDQPMNRRWVALNSAVRSLVTNDRKRLVYFQNLDLDHHSPQKVLSLKKAVDACVQKTDCIQPEYSKDDETFISNVYNYSYFKGKIEEKKDRALLLKFQKSLKNDYEYVGFVASEKIRAVKTGGKTLLHLPLNGSEFSATQKSQLQSYMESVWKSDLIEVLVEWKDAATDIYKVFFDIQNPGKRSHVSTYNDDGVQKYEMVLYPFTSTGAIAHEAGHTIGFPDHYYPTWDSYTCTYHTEYNPGDIMSDSEGKVTADEWVELKAAY